MSVSTGAGKAATNSLTRTLLECVASPAFMVTRSGSDIAAANRAACEALGYSQQELEQLPFTDVAPEFAAELLPVANGRSVTSADFPSEGVRIPAEWRRRDAIHPAADLAVGDDLDVLITYDERLAAAAHASGVATAAPGA